MVDSQERLAGSTGDVAKVAGGLVIGAVLLLCVMRKMSIAISV